MKSPHVCIVGYGYWGPKLVRNFLAAGTTVSVCEQSLERRAQAEKDFPQICAPDKDFTWFLQQCAASVDAIVIATPPSTHFPLALAALQAGKHVLVEKPLCLTEAHARQLEDAAKDAGRVLMVDHTFLYHPAVQTLRALLASDHLGELQSFESVRVNHGLFQKDTNVIWDLAVHDLSILLHLVAERPLRVSASGAAHNPQGQADIATVTLSYASGFYATIQVSWLSPVKVRRLAIGGTVQTAVWDDLDAAAPLKIYDCSTSFAADRAAYRLGGMSSPRLENTEALRGMAEDFLVCIRTGAEPVASPRLAREVVKILTCAQSSLLHGRSIPLYL